MAAYWVYLDLFQWSNWNKSVWRWIESWLKVDSTLQWIESGKWVKIWWELLLLNQPLLGLNPSPLSPSPVALRKLDCTEAVCGKKAPHMERDYRVKYYMDSMGTLKDSGMLKFCSQNRDGYRILNKENKSVPSRTTTARTSPGCVDLNVPWLDLSKSVFFQESREVPEDKMYGRLCAALMLRMGVAF